MSELTKNRCMTRRQLLAFGLMGAAGRVMSPLVGNAAVSRDDLKAVSLMPEMAERDGPLLVFRDFVSDADVEVKRHIRHQMRRKNDLYALLKKKIGFDKQVHLKLEEVQVRLMYVPQRPQGPGAAYHRYCHSIIAFLFGMIQTDNFYSTITSPIGSYPPLADDGLSAFLVHRLAKDYQAICRFTAESGRSVKYRASGAIFSNHLGAVDLEIEFLSHDQVRLKRRPFTIWQNSSSDFYTLMALPVEETLHYYVGRATDKQLAEALCTTPPRNVSEAQEMAETWIAVEESIVGGLVAQVVRDYCTRHHMAFPPMDVEETRSLTPALHQYKYRRDGMALVREMGFHGALDLYMRDPAAYRDLIAARQRIS